MANGDCETRLPAPCPSDELHAMTDAPPPAEADDKDWTWVLERPCPECGAEVGAMGVADIAAANRQNAAGWTEVLAGDGEWVRARPAPETWSPLEYACHVRDVFRLFSERLDLMLSEDDPEFANWNPNITAEAERYDLADPALVSAELVEAASAIADAFEQLSVDQLARTGRRSDGASFTVQSFARYEIHDPIHHLWDVTKG